MQILPKPDYRQTLNFADAINSDIITVIHNNFKTAAAQTKEFAKQFRGETALQSAENIWKFLKSHIQYKRDSGAGQLVRLPSRFVADGEGDCKSYALFAASVLANLQMPVTFRYASYTSSKIPSHVYVSTRDEEGREIIIDGVWKFFNSEKPFDNKIDKVMRVYTLSGTNDEIGFSIKRLSFRSFGNWLSRNFKSAFKDIKKVGLAIPRRAFRTMVAVNFHGFGTGVKKAFEQNPSKISRTWESLGGKPSALLQSAKVGAKRKRILGIQEEGVGAPFLMLLAAAAPILIAMMPVIAGLLNKKDGDKLREVADSANQAWNQVTGKDVDNPLDKPEAYEKDKGVDDSPKFKLNPLWIGAGALAALYLVTSSKSRK